MLRRNTMTDGLDEPADLPMPEALADARRRPWLYRLADDVREYEQGLYEVLCADGCNGPLVQRVARTLALDIEARNAASTRPF